MPWPPKREGAATSARTALSHAEKAPRLHEPRSESLDATVAALKERKERLIPSKPTPVVIVVDKSGSMSDYHPRTGEFTSLVVTGMKEIDPRALNVIFLLVLVMGADGIKTNGWQKLGEATDVPHEDDGPTPLGKTLDLASDRLHTFVFEDLVKADSHSRPPEVLVLSDLHPTGEASEVTEAGFEKLVALVKKLKGRITVVGPTPELTHQENARKLLGPERPVKYLDSDPKGLLKIVLNTMTGK
jgi:hypothetical protein